MHLRGALIVASNEAEQDLGQEAALFGPQPSHDAEVDRDQTAVVVDEQIAGMHVGVEEAIAQRVPQEALEHSVAERRQIEAAGLERGAVIEWRAVDPFQRQYLTRGAVPVHRRHAEVQVRAGILRHLGERGRFQPEIHFHRHRAGERRHRFDRPQSLRFDRQAFRLARGVEEGIEIEFEAALDVGPQDFHRHRLVDAFLRDLRPMYLRDRGGGDGGPEAGINVRHRLAESGGDHGFRLTLRKRRHLVLQAFEIARDGSADHVGPGGEKLAELDVSRSELGERGGEPARAVFCRGAFDQAGERDCGLRWKR